ncbi:hypothetical protein CCACVL1_22617 [Corchorus capsularis]|uniref:Non-haem dioxygenase N-terminal domain-containing protein n=1 Tax=Corchorus capsularis TaxID=210143 RepID=A0A1R3GXL0_COCAP|nr:hypothetical protein CCACVL1_22617 [Corchorus capsularis]
MAPTITSVKALADSLKSSASIPTTYSIQSKPNIVNEEAVSDATESIPTIDFTLLTSTNPEERSKAIQELGKACEDWGFFVVTNHGVAESTMNGMIEASRAFFELSEEEKKEYEGQTVVDPIRFGTSSGPADKVMFWRDFLKIFVHPKFNSPNKPPGFRQTWPMGWLAWPNAQARRGPARQAWRVGLGMAVWATL